MADTITFTGVSTSATVKTSPCPVCNLQLAPDVHVCPGCKNIISVNVRDCLFCNTKINVLTEVCPKCGRTQEQDPEKYELLRQIKYFSDLREGKISQPMNYTEYLYSKEEIEERLVELEYKLHLLEGGKRNKAYEAISGFGAYLSTPSPSLPGEGL